MGQTTFALVYGHVGRAPNWLEEGWSELCERYSIRGGSIASLHGEDVEGLGAYVAIGSRGMEVFDGIPDMPTMLVIGDLLVNRVIRKRILVDRIIRKRFEFAKKSWTKFYERVTAAEPRFLDAIKPGDLYLVQIEVA